MSDKKEMKKSTLSLEKLSYNLSQNPTMIKEKNQKVFYPHKSSYKDGESIVLTLNSGSDFINAKNSYLSFKLQVETQAPLTAGTHFVSFGTGSASNLFQEIIIRSRDGSEISRVRELNSLVATRDRYTKSKEWFKTEGSVQGYMTNYLENGDNDEFSRDEMTNNLTNGYDFTIPMSSLSGLFASDKILPPMLMSGMRIEIVLAEKYSALYYTPDTTLIDLVGYTLSDVQFRFETLKVSDSVMNQISQNASNSGLYLTFDTFDLTQNSVKETANIEIRKNVSQCQSVMVKSRLIETVEGKSSAPFDSMGSEVHSVSNYRFRIGSQFIPSSVVDSKSEHFTLSQIAMGKHKTSENDITLKSFLLQGKSVIASDFSRSDLSLSGVSISNSKVLAYEGKYDNDSDRRVSIHLKFKRLLRIFLTNTIIED